MYCIVSSRPEILYSIHNPYCASRLVACLEHKPSPSSLCRSPNIRFKSRSRPADSDMGLAYNVYLNCKRIYGCKTCKTHLADHDDIVSRVRPGHCNSFWAPPSLRLQNFRGQHGKAFLFNSVVNIVAGEAGERNMTTGRHVVRDITCRQCKETVGWKYDKAYEPAEKYKEGKYILEAELLCSVN